MVKKTKNNTPNNDKKDETTGPKVRPNFLGRNDYGLDADASKPKVYSMQSYEFTSFPSEKIRLTGRYADNAMHDPSGFALYENNDDAVDRLYELVSPHLTDDQIIAGYRLTPKAMGRAAGYFNVSTRDIHLMFNTLRHQLKKKLDEDRGVRYSVDADSLGNATIHDGKTGRNKRLNGADGQDLLVSLKDKPHGSMEEQELLSSIFHGKSGNRLMDEIKADNGSCNIQWNSGKRHGFATVQYSGEAGNMKISFPQVTEFKNGNLEVIQPDQHLLKILKHTFIEKSKSDQV